MFYCYSHCNNPTVSHIYWWPDERHDLTLQWWTQGKRLSAQRCTELLCGCRSSGPTDRLSGSPKMINCHLTIIQYPHSTFLQSWSYNSAWACSVSIIKTVSLLTAYGCHGSQVLRSLNRYHWNHGKQGVTWSSHQGCYMQKTALAVQGWDWEETGDSCILRRFIIFWAFTWYYSQSNNLGQAGQGMKLTDQHYSLVGPDLPRSV